MAKWLEARRMAGRGVPIWERAPNVARRIDPQTGAETPPYNLHLMRGTLALPRAAVSASPNRPLRGARLIGIYDSQVTFGQSRALLLWTRLIMPNGRSIVLERQLGADTAGYAGLEDQVDNHWGELFKAAALSTFLAIGTELGAGSDTNSSDSAIIQALRHGASGSLNQTGQQVVRRSLSIQPTLTVRPGFLVRVHVDHDLILTPYRG
ncbi:hypothetical protein ACVWW6_000596 [Bradyrhizobium sp. USDA 3311]